MRYDSVSIPQYEARLLEDGPGAVLSEEVRKRLRVVIHDVYILKQ